MVQLFLASDYRLKNLNVSSRQFFADFLVSSKNHVKVKVYDMADCLGVTMPSVGPRPPKEMHAISCRDLAGVTAASGPHSRSVITVVFHQTGRVVVTHEEMRVSLTR